GATPLDAAASGSNGQKGNWWARSGLVARIAVSAFAVGVGLALVFAVLFLAITGLRHRSLEARHSQQVLATANQLETLVVDLETGVRGFAITHNETYLQPWVRARHRYPKAISGLITMTRDNPKQHALALSIKRTIDGYLGNYSVPLVGFMRRNPHLARPIIVNEIRIGRARTENLRGQFDRFIATERALSITRDKTARTTAEPALLVGGLGLPAALLLILLRPLSVNPSG